MPNLIVFVNYFSVQKDHGLCSTTMSVNFIQTNRFLFNVDIKIVDGLVE